MLPSQVNSYWGLVSDVLAKGLPPVCGMNQQMLMDNILKAILGGKMMCWMACEYDEDGGMAVPYAFILTTITKDECSGVKSLDVYDVVS